ncbi:MAG: HNH endonuclease [Candidatus Nomurabacteria bacterium]|jgi:hypothetical protein|nr:HNH endonuclease [Candidatus Nomurabacteria bacterium]
MAFSEKLKLEVKKKAAFRCVICHEPFVEVHHIVPKKEGGTDAADNAAPLCATHHDLFGDNPSKRKQIREMRDHWYRVIESYVRDGKLEPIQPLDRREIGTRVRSCGSIAIYHYVFEDEDFETSAQILFKLVQAAQKQQPGANRVLYLDIEGHRNKQGGYDHDMYELQTEFMLGLLMNYISEVYMPLNHCLNSGPQDDDIPGTLAIGAAPSYRTAKNDLRSSIAPRTTFKLLGVPIGAELVFMPDQSIKCTVVSLKNQVEYEGLITTLSRMANNILGGHLNGFNYFMYKGQKLADLRRRLDESYQ